MTADLVHHEVIAYLREYSHQGWVSSQVSSLREYSHHGWMSSQVGYLCTHSRLVLLRLTYLGRIVDLIVLFFYGTGCVDGSGSLSGGAFNQLKLVTLSIV